MDATQVKKAVKALTQHVKVASKKEGAKDQLIEEDTPFWLVISTKQVQTVKVIKPIRIKLAHPLYTEDSEVCIFTKDPQKDFKERIAAANAKAIKKVIGVSKLKAKYKPHEAKRQLCSQYDVFLADDRVVPLLPPLLGKTFLAKKKLPVPVDLTKEDIGKEIMTALGCTTFYRANGACTSVKVGLESHSVAQLVENIMTATPLIVDKIARKWDNIKSIHLKTSESLALPLYLALPDAPVAAAEAVEESDVADKSKDMDGELEAPAKKALKVSHKTKSNIPDRDFIDIDAEQDDKLMKKLGKRIGLKLV